MLHCYRWIWATNHQSMAAVAAGGRGTPPEVAQQMGVAQPAKWICWWSSCRGVMEALQHRRFGASRLELGLPLICLVYRSSSVTIPEKSVILYYINQLVVANCWIITLIACLAHHQR